MKISICAICLSPICYAAFVARAITSTYIGPTPPKRKAWVADHRVAPEVITSSIKMTARPRNLSPWRGVRASASPKLAKRASAPNPSWGAVLRSLFPNQFIATGVTAGFANKLGLRPTGATKTKRDFNPVTTAQAIRRKGPCFGPIKDLQTGREHLHKPPKFSKSLSP